MTAFDPKNAGWGKLAGFVVACAPFGVKDRILQEARFNYFGKNYYRVPGVFYVMLLSTLLNSPRVCLH